MKSQRVYLWRKHVEPGKVDVLETKLSPRAGLALVVVTQTGHKRILLEIAFQSQKDARNLARDFGGEIAELRRGWQERFDHAQKAKPIKIGNRLVVARNGGLSASRTDSSCGEPAAAAVRKPALFVIPAGIAFGTGEHATTAMSLRLLEKISRGWKQGWSLVDLGTGTGILALAAKSWGAKRVIGIDDDPIAISTARENARRNKIDHAHFHVADVREWKVPDQIDIVTANLFSELLIEVLPDLKRSRWLILSGILRGQEKQFVRALRRNKIEIVQVRRRGKWIAVLAANSN